MPGTLYIVGTPIGNLQDITPRAAATLGMVDFIAAEDTRVTRKLLTHLGIKKPLISYHEHNAIFRGEEIIARLAGGENAALCTDAGLPAISDPGELLVADAITAGIPVVPIPGPCAAVTALCVSGQPTARFVFEGFLPQNQRRRSQHLAQLQTETRTVIFYEAPHKLLRTLQDLAAAFGPGRSVTLCRELTKLHEEICKTTLGEAVQLYTEKSPRGEFVLVLAGGQPPTEDTTPALTLQEAAALARRLAETEALSASEAARRAAKESGHPKSAIYKAMQG